MPKSQTITLRDRRTLPGVRETKTAWVGVYQVHDEPDDHRHMVVLFDKRPVKTAKTGNVGEDRTYSLVANNGRVLTTMPLEVFNAWFGVTLVPTYDAEAKSVTQYRLTSVFDKFGKVQKTVDKPAPEKPDLKTFSAAVERTIETFMENKVRPYLVHLLDTAQAKTAKRLRFEQGMGTYFISRDGEPWHDVSDAEGEAEWIRSKRHETQELAKRFPELVEILEAAGSCEVTFRYTLGDIAPTVPRRVLGAGEADPADVEDEDDA